MERKRRLKIDWPEDKKWQWAAMDKDGLIVLYTHVPNCREEDGRWVIDTGAGLVYKSAYDPFDFSKTKHKDTWMLTLTERI